MKAIDKQKSTLKQRDYCPTCGHKLHKMRQVESTLRTGLTIDEEGPDKLVGLKELLRIIREFNIDGVQSISIVVQVGTGNVVQIERGGRKI